MRRPPPFVGRKGPLKADEGAVAGAQLQLDYGKITAPIGGRIGLKRQVDVGNYITGSDTNGIVVITQTYPIDVVFTVPEAGNRHNPERAEIRVSRPW
ncbi:hypothetical protein [Streptomyces sp. HP-A2021]|uniref:hypothetical protein n=1 Tax=Streptomyces sp. HP-A2021 TaxID=2927875 RepID=UPI0024355C19|nr:hypothetical protein [Streptomyces sp. HP-A2021]